MTGPRSHAECLPRFSPEPGEITIVVEKQSHSSVYAAFFQFANLFAACIVTICFEDRVYMTTTFFTWVLLYTHVKRICKYQDV